MTETEIKKIANFIRGEEERVELRKDFLENGVKFFDKFGWGYIRDKVKHYEEKKSN